MSELAATLHDADWLAARLEAGASINVIAAECGVTRQAVQSWIKRHGIVHVPPAPRPHPNRPSPSALAKLYNKFGTLAALAEHLDVTQPTVGKWCKEDGIAVHRPGRRPVQDGDVTRWRKQKAKGWTNAAIAESAGVGLETVRRHLTGDP